MNKTLLFNIIITAFLLFGLAFTQASILANIAVFFLWISAVAGTIGLFQDQQKRLEYMQNMPFLQKMYKERLPLVVVQFFAVSHILVLVYFNFVYLPVFLLLALIHITITRRYLDENYKD